MDAIKLWLFNCVNRSMNVVVTFVREVEKSRNDFKRVLFNFVEFVNSEPYYIRFVLRKTVD